MNAKQNNIRVLIVDDDEDDFIIINDYLSEIPYYSFTTEWCYNYQKAVERIQQKDCDLFLIDYRLGAKTGLMLIREAVASGCQEPMILLTGKGNPEIDREATRYGATDYLIKSELGSEKLERSIRYALDRAASLKALRANEKKYRNIFEHSREAIFLTDNEGVFYQVNSATALLLGLNNDYTQKSITDFIATPAAKELVYKTLQAGEEIKEMELEIKVPEGDVHYCILSLSKQTDDVQHHYQAILHDITERKRAEKAALQAEKLAAAGRLVRTLAHEVRNPLNNINLSLEQALEINNNDELQMYLDIIARNSERINDLIRDLLQSLRYSEMKRESISLQELIENVINSARDSLALKRINLQVDKPEETALIRGDKEKLLLGLSNLINNSIEAIEHERGEIFLYLSKTDQAYRLILSDNGYGMNQEQLSRLFEPYYTTKRNGMGLGMVSTLNILQAHGATIDVQSMPGTGTTFTIHFYEA